MQPGANTGLDAFLRQNELPWSAVQAQARARETSQVVVIPPAPAGNGTANQAGTNAAA